MAPSLRVAAQIVPSVVVGLDLGATKAFALRLVSAPRTKTRPWGPRFWPDFRSQRWPPLYVDAP